MIYSVASNRKIVKQSGESNEALFERIKPFLGGIIMQSIHFLSTPKIIAGIDSIDTVAQHTAGFGKKPLILIGSGSFKRNGTLERLTAAIKSYAIFENIPSDPDIQIVNAGLEAYKQQACDFLIAAGGGSVLDAAKAIAFMALNSGGISDYISGLKSSSRALPIESAGIYGNVIRFLCPLVITDEQLDAGLKIYEDAIIACLDRRNGRA